MSHDDTPSAGGARPPLQHLRYLVWCFPKDTPETRDCVAAFHDKSDAIEYAAECVEGDFTGCEITEQPS